MTALTDYTKLKDGDLIFIRSHSDNADHIAKVTNSNLTHCGMAFHQQDRIIVYEGAGRGEYLDLAEWRKRESKSGGPLEPIFVRRLVDRDAQLPLEKRMQLKGEAAKLHETRYDFAFAWNNYSDGPNKEFVYCSELLYKAYDALDIKLGTPHPMRDYFASMTPAKVKELTQLLNDHPKARACRNGADFDPDELIISPQEVYESPVLEDVTD